MANKLAALSLLCIIIATALNMVHVSARNVGTADKSNDFKELFIEKCKSNCKGDISCEKGCDDFRHNDKIIEGLEGLQTLHTVANELDKGTNVKSTNVKSSKVSGSNTDKSDDFKELFIEKCKSNCKGDTSCMKGCDDFRHNDKIIEGLKGLQTLQTAANELDKGTNVKSSKVSGSNTAEADKFDDFKELFIEKCKSNCKGDTSCMKGCDDFRHNDKIIEGLKGLQTLQTTVQSSKVSGSNTGEADKFDDFKELFIEKCKSNCKGDTSCMKGCDDFRHNDKIIEGLKGLQTLQTTVQSSKVSGSNTGEAAKFDDFKELFIEKCKSNCKGDTSCMKGCDDFRHNDKIIEGLKGLQTLQTTVQSSKVSGSNTGEAAKFDDFKELFIEKCKSNCKGDTSCMKGCDDFRHNDKIIEGLKGLQTLQTTVQSSKVSGSNTGEAAKFDDFKELFIEKCKSNCKGDTSCMKGCDDFRHNDKIIEGLKGLQILQTTVESSKVSGSNTGEADKFDDFKELFIEKCKSNCKGDTSCMKGCDDFRHNDKIIEGLKGLQTLQTTVQSSKVSGSNTGEAAKFDDFKELFIEKCKSNCKGDTSCMKGCDDFRHNDKIIEGLKGLQTLQTTVQSSKVSGSNTGEADKFDDFKELFIEKCKSNCKGDTSCMKGCDDFRHNDKIIEGLKGLQTLQTTVKSSKVSGSNTGEADKFDDFKELFIEKCKSNCKGDTSCMKGCDDFRHNDKIIEGLKGLQTLQTTANELDKGTNVKSSKVSGSNTGEVDKSDDFKELFIEKCKSNCKGDTSCKKGCDDFRHNDKIIEGLKTVANEIDEAGNIKSNKVSTGNAGATDKSVDSKKCLDECNSLCKGDTSCEKNCDAFCHNEKLIQGIETIAKELHKADNVQSSKVSTTNAGAADKSVDSKKCFDVCKSHCKGDASCEKNCDALCHNHKVIQGLKGLKTAVNELNKGANVKS